MDSRSPEQTFQGNSENQKPASASENTTPLDIQPDNLPIVIKDNLPSSNRNKDTLPEEQITETITELSTFLERYIEATTVEDENKLLNRINHTFLDGTKQLVEQLESLKRIKKDRNIKDKSIAYFIQERKILKLIHSSSAKNSEIVELFNQLSQENEDGIHKILSLDTELETSQEQSVVQDALASGTEVKIEKGRTYDGLINLLTIDKATLTTVESVISKHLQLQEQLIHTEYQERARTIVATIEKFKAIRHLNYPRDLIENTLSSRNFEIEDPSLYPDYIIAKDCLEFIHNWTEKTVFNKEGYYNHDYGMISYLDERKYTDNDAQIKMILELSKKLFNQVNPNLQEDWMQETIDLLNCAVHRKDNLRSQKEFIRRKAEVNLKLVTGAKIEVPSLPDYLTSQDLENIKRSGRELVFSPNLNFGSLAELQKIGAEEYIKKLKQYYPNLHTYRFIRDNFRNAKQKDLDSRDLSFWESVLAEEIPFPKLPGKWIAVDTLNTSQQDQIPIAVANRETSWDEADQLIKVYHQDFLLQSGLKSGEVRMLEPFEWLILYNKDWIRHTDSEWTNCKFNQSDNKSGHLMVFCHQLDDIMHNSPLVLTRQKEREPTNFRTAIVLPDSLIA